MATAATVDELIRVRLRRIRKARGLKSKDVARMAGMAPSTYCAIETGQNAIKLGRLVAILEALELDIADLWPWDHLDQLLQAQRKAQLKRQSYLLGDVATILEADGAVLFCRDEGRWKPVLCAGVDEDLALRMSFCPLSGPCVTKVVVRQWEFCFVPVGVRVELGSRFLSHMVSRIADVIASDPLVLRTAIENQAQA